MNAGGVLGWAAGACLLIGLGVGLVAGGAWDRRPAGWPDYPVRLGPIHFHIGFGDGLGAQLAIATANLKTCQANTRTLQSAIDTQNAAVKATAAAGQAMQSKAQAAVRQAHGNTVAAEHSAAALIATKDPTTDQCAAALALVHGVSQ